MSKTPALETQFTYGNTRNPIVDSNSTDCAQYVGPNGSIVSWIDADGFGQGNLASGSVLQTSALIVDTNQPQVITNTNIATSMYGVGIYIESYADGASNTTLVATISWTNAQNVQKSVELTLSGTEDDIQQENYVMLALAGSSIIVSTAFSSTSFHYDLAVAVTLFPIGGSL